MVHAQKQSNPKKTKNLFVVFGETNGGVAPEQPDDEVLPTPLLRTQISFIKQTGVHEMQFDAHVSARPRA